MQTGRISIYDKDLIALKEYVSKKLTFKYQNVTNDSVVLVGESYRILSDNYEAYVLVMSLLSDNISVEIFSGGSDFKIISTFIDSDIDFVLEARKVINDYASRNGFITN